jgi:hypothetical protein
MAKTLAKFLAKTTFEGSMSKGKVSRQRPPTLFRVQRFKYVQALSGYFANLYNHVWFAISVES